MSERLLALDPGAERQGWIVFERSEKSKSKPPISLALGYFGVPRNLKESKDKKDNTPYQEYRLSVIDLWTEQTPILLERYEPDEVVSEIVPPVGGGNFVVATQSQLAQTAITTVQVVSKQYGVPVYQVGATTVKANIGGNKKATKVVVRNGVFKLCPELEIHKKEWTKVFEVSDAAAIGLTHWGYKNDRN
jgi:Holliday junction resolvasome RuvABC endonuclease subunit